MNPVMLPAIRSNMFGFVSLCFSSVRKLRLRKRERGPASKSSTPQQVKFSNVADLCKSQGHIYIYIYVGVISVCCAIVRREWL